MKESTLIETVNALLVFATLFLINGLSIFINEEHSDLIIRTPKTKFEQFREREQPPEPYMDYKQNLEGAQKLLTKINKLDIQYDYIHTEYIGVCFITSYCPQECGYVEYSDGTDNFPNGWMTATDTICHYSDSNWQPTTCAIDPHYFGFGEVLMVDGKTYVTEDTGAFRGMWVDVFRPTYEEMAEHGSHYSEVYSVEFRRNVIAYHQEREKIHESITNYLCYRCFGTRFPDRNNI